MPKEAKLVVCIWLIGLIYTAVVIGLWGYVPPAERPDQPSLIFGVPSWVVWGLFVPWVVQVGVTWWFALRVLKDDEPYVDWNGTKPGGERSEPPG